jgi:hypothetical protein
MQLPFSAPVFAPPWKNPHVENRKTTLPTMLFESRSSKSQRRFSLLPVDPCSANAMPHVHLPVLLSILASGGLRELD